MDGTIAQILNNKGREFIAVDNTASLFSCALEMQQQGVGSLLVFEDQKLVGIFVFIALMLNVLILEPIGIVMKKIL